MTAIPDQSSKAIWWSPSDTERRNPIPGLYWTNATGAPYARVFGQILGPGTSAVHSDVAVLPILYGHVSGEAVTLIDARFVRSSSGPSGDESDLRAAYSLSGDFLLAENELTFTDIQVQFWDQTTWADWRSFADDELHPPSIRASKREAIELQANNGNLTIEDWPTYRGGRFDWHLSSACRFRIHSSEPISWVGLVNNWINPLELLIVTGTGRPSGVKTMYVANSGWTDDTNAEASAGHNSPELQWLQVKTFHLSRPDNELGYFDLLHCLDDFGPAFDLRQHFSACARFAYSIEQFADVKAGLSGSRLSSFVALAHAVEAIDRGGHLEQKTQGQDAWARLIDRRLGKFLIPRKYRSAAVRGVNISHRLSLAARLGRLDSEIGGLITGILGHRQWKNDVADARNTVAHGLHAAEMTRRDSRGVQASTILLTLLFEAKWLTLIGFSDTQTRSMLARRRNQSSIQAAMVANYAHIASLSSTRFPS